MNQKNASNLIKLLSQQDASNFANAKPFPHIVLDGFFPQEDVDAIHNSLFQQSEGYWEKSNDQGIEVKWRSKWQSDLDIPEPAASWVRFLNSGPFLRELSRLTSIPNLISDPYYTGGGFNLIRRGGYLDIHVDGNWHDAMQVHRRLNLIVYLNKNWTKEWGGELNFYDDKGDVRITSILPVGNRMVIFETHDLSYHGHPEPLLCPDSEARTSIILYYYTSAARPGHQVAVEAPHSALWKSKGWLDKRGNQTRQTFNTPPGDEARPT